MSKLVVVKYGGSTLKSANAFRAAAQYQIRTSPVALVSAVNGATNLLMDAYERKTDTSRLKDAYWGIAKPLPSAIQEEAMGKIEKQIELLGLYQDIGARDAFIGAGEGHSAILLSSHINALGRKSDHLTGPDAGFFLDDHGIVDMGESLGHLEKIGDRLKEGNIIIVGGYLGRNRKNEYSLGARNINDAFATALAVALHGTSVEIIKDVPGVYRVDPEYGNFGLLERLSYDEAGKMSWRGSPVVHPAVIKLAKNISIPIVVKSMESSGTVISPETQSTQEHPVAALVPDRTFMVTVRDELMDTPEGRGYFALISRFEQEFGADIGLIAADIGGISYTVSWGDRKRGKNEDQLPIHNVQLRDFLNSHGYKPVVEGQEVGMVTIVGDGMKQRAGTLSQMSGVLAQENISVRSAAQSDERYSSPTITFVVDSDNLKPSVEALAAELFA